MKTLKLLIFPTQVLVLLGVLSSSIHAQTQSSALITTKISDSFYIITDPRPNGSISVGVHLGNEGIVVVDTLPADRKNSLVAAVKAISDKPVRYVLNTYTQESRTGANQAFQEQGATVISAVDEYPTWLGPEDGTADITYADKLTLRVDNENIQLIHARIHTLGDSIIKFENSNVIFTSWAYTSELLPQSENFVRQMQAYDTILDMADEKTLIVPALGRLSKKADLIQYRQRLVEFKSQVLSLHDKGLDVDAISAHASLRKIVDQLSDRINSDKENLRNAETQVLRSVVSTIVLNQTHQNPLLLTGEQRQAYVGTYQINEGETVDIIALDDSLRLGRQTNQYFTYELSPTQKQDVFYIAGNGTQIVFERNTDQQVQQLKIIRSDSNSIAIKTD